MDLDIDFLQIENKTAPKQGTILISEPFTQDTYFGRSVVLLTEHNENGSLGFILNKPVEVSLQDVISDFPIFDATISIGGPVNTEAIFYIHSLGDKIPNSTKVSQNIYWGGDFDILKLLIESGAVQESQVRFFIGYSGWKPNQLQSEIDRNFWIVTDLYFNDVFTNDKRNIWKSALHKLGEKYKLWTNFPANPSYN